MLKELPNPFDRGDDVVDSRNVIARIEELQEMAAGGEALDAGQADELAALVAVAKECEDYAEDWHHGVPLIRETYFAEYMKDYFMDTSDSEVIAEVRAWPFNHIDWNAAADEMRPDYTEVTYRGETFLVR